MNPAFKSMNQIICRCRLLQTDIVHKYQELMALFVSNLFKIYDSYTSYIYVTPQTSHSDQNHVHKESALYNIYTNIYNHARLYFVN